MKEERDLYDVNTLPKKLKKMGTRGSLPQEQLDELLKTTKFKAKELRRWHVKFTKDYPNGFISRIEFAKVFDRIYRAGSGAKIAAHIFRCFDTNGDNYLSFKELMCGFSVISRGTEREKLQWTFNLYDVNGDGYITLDELSTVVGCLRRIGNEKPIRNKQLLNLFLTMDDDGDGRLSLDEFVNAIETDGNLVHMLNGTYITEHLRRHP